MKSSDVPNVDIFPHETPDISWNLGNYVLHHPQKKKKKRKRKPSACHNAIPKSSKFLSHVPKKPRGGWMIFSSYSQRPNQTRIYKANLVMLWKVLRWASAYWTPEMLTSECGIPSAHSQHAAPFPLCTSDVRWPSVSPLASPRSKLEQPPTFSLKIRLFVWVIYCMFIAGENKFFFSWGYCFLSGPQNFYLFPLLCSKSIIFMRNHP